MTTKHTVSIVTGLVLVIIFLIWQNRRTESIDSEKKRPIDAERSANKEKAIALIERALQFDSCMQAAGIALIANSEDSFRVAKFHETYYTFWTNAKDSIDAKNRLYDGTLEYYRMQWIDDSVRYRNVLKRDALILDCQ
jgi:hypothetical protein